ncbi:MAG: PD-(D/E)XK nuclease family protein [Bacteroidota bacterium]
MHLYFGLAFDDIVQPRDLSLEAGVNYLGPKGVLHFLEQHLGLVHPPADIEHLRIEQYRQAVYRYLEVEEMAFFKASFEADQLATASALLAMRDELLLANWSFGLMPNMPERLQVLAIIEQYFQATDSEETPLLLSPGFADRFNAILEALPRRQHPIQQVSINEPLDLLPSHYRRLFDLLTQQKVKINSLNTPSPVLDSDLGQFQQMLLNRDKPVQKQSLKADGSLLIIKAERETAAADYLARLFRRNPNFRPYCLIPEKNRALDNALIQEGLPSLGIRSASLARPSLQILKLVTTFFWEPIDPYKILEFVSLAVKPLSDELGNIIASEIAQTPGLQGEGWKIAIRRYFEQLEEAAGKDKKIDAENIRQQYQFWFSRTRHNINHSVPKSEVIEVFDYLSRWASEEYEERNKNNPSLRVLSSQAQRIKELLEVLPERETRLSNLELERIVRTIYEPSPITFREEALDHLPYLHQSSAVIDAVDRLVWWNFSRNEQDHFFSIWYQSELTYLKQEKVRLQGPTDKNQLLLWQRPRPVHYTRQQLLLIMPEKVDGTAVYPHPLHDELEARFDNLSTISLHLSKGAPSNFDVFFELPRKEQLPFYPLGRPKAFLKSQRPDLLGHSEQETFSSLDTLFYYPYQWVFRRKLLLRKSSILSIVPDPTLMGNLAHRFFELMFDEDIHDWDRNRVNEWIDQQAHQLLTKEGAVLLMYGREPDRIAFINRIKYAAWSLLSLIQNNAWQIKATELDLNGRFEEVDLKGKADLVLQRGEELAIIDLKWRGAARRERVIRNEEDLQLILYARLLHPEQPLAPHSAYFIIEVGKMISRNNRAFKEIVAVSPESDPAEIKQRIFQRMAATYQWRMSQLKTGEIEVRTRQTVPSIEERYSDQLMDLLEMKEEDAPFDDYRTLINLID